MSAQSIEYHFDVYEESFTIGTGPVTLQFKQVLQGCHRTCPKLHHALNGHLMSLDRDVTTSVSDEIHLEDQ